MISLEAVHEAVELRSLLRLHSGAIVGVAIVVNGRRDRRALLQIFLHGEYCFRENVYGSSIGSTLGV